MLQPISAAVLAILSSGRASVRNSGHARMEEDIASAFLGSNAAPGTVAGPILVSLPSNQQRSQFRRPAVSHSPQWWTTRMEEDIVLTHHPAVFVSLSVQQFACTMVDLLEWKRTSPLPNT